MRIRVNIDGLHHECDSTDPELLGRWLIEVFGRHQWFEATFCQVDVQPSFPSRAPDGKLDDRCDWIADVRYFDVWAPKSPRELLKMMGQTLDRYEADKADQLL
jgi:hypothetical protein